MTSVVADTARALYRPHRARILLTYGLTLLENAFNLLYPFATGLAINGLLAGRYDGLLLFGGLWLAHTAAGVARQRLDTRTFTRIYAEVATRVVLEQDRQGLPTSQIVARSALAREFVDFFERDIPMLITSLVGFFGSLIMLFVYDLPTGAACLLLLPPVALASRAYARRAAAFNTALNDELEREVDVLTHRRPAEVRHHFRLLARHRVRLSDAEAANWGVLELFVIALAAFVIVRAVSMPGAQAGTIYAIIAYLYSFAESLEGVPFLVQQLARLRDIGLRMRAGEPT